MYKKGFMLNQKYYIISLFFIIIGTSIILYPKISNYLENKNYIQIIKEYKEDVSNMNMDNKEKEYENARKYNEKISQEKIGYINDEKNTNKYEEILNTAGNGIMAYIEIPKISCYLPIYHDTKDEIMKKGIGHLKNTSLPIGGKSNHSVLTGHTGLLKAELFTRIKELELKDYFYIYTLGEKLIYEIYQIKVVLPTEVEDLQIVDGKDLVTLVTCTPYGINTHRLLVQGERIETFESEKEEKNYDIIEEKNKNSKNNNYYLIGSICSLIILFCCILFNYVVKYIKKLRQ